MRKRRVRSCLKYINFNINEFSSTNNAVCWQTKKTENKQGKTKAWKGIFCRSVWYCLAVSNHVYRLTYRTAYRPTYRIAYRPTYGTAYRGPWICLKPISKLTRSVWSYPTWGENLYHKVRSLIGCNNGKIIQILKLKNSIKKANT